MGIHMPVCVRGNLVAGYDGCPYLNVRKNFLIDLLHWEAIDLISAHLCPYPFLPA